MYIGSMPRKAAPGEKRSEMLTAKVPPSVKDAILRIVREDDRTESYVALALVVRGLAAYARDGKLTEPEGGSVRLKDEENPIEYVTAKTEKGYRAPGAGKRKTN